VHYPAVVDDHQTRTEPLDVGKVVRGQHQCGVPGGTDGRDERPYGLLADHVEADRRLVQEQHIRAV